MGYNIERRKKKSGFFDDVLMAGLWSLRMVYVLLHDTGLCVDWNFVVFVYFGYVTEFVMADWIMV